MTNILVLPSLSTSASVCNELLRADLLMSQKTFYLTALSGESFYTSFSVPKSGPTSPHAVPKTEIQFTFDVKRS